MNPLRTNTALLVMMMALAGCLGATDADPAAAPSSTAPDPTVSDDFGGLRVMVTTTELAPVEGAEVLLFDTEHSTMTDEAGQANFGGLNPGSYTVIAGKPGYVAVQERGRYVDVVAGEVIEVKLQLDLRTVISADNSYHRAVPLIGFLGCSLAGQPGTVGYTSYPCKGVTVAGMALRDPNDNSTHPWEVDSIQVQGIVLEMRWAPTVPGTAGQLRVGTYRSPSCTTTAAGSVCNYSSAIGETWGPSPVYGQRFEGEAANITKHTGKKTTDYPSKVVSEIRANCDERCTGATFVFQQKYEGYATAFYGLAPPAGWKIFPS